MGVILYNIFLALYKGSIFLAALFNSKAKKWVKGRKNIFKKLLATIPQNEKIIWMHCASLGEFEQGRPLLEKLRIESPKHKILLTFFSPSGYEVQKDYKGVDWVFYLPVDGPRNAKRFLQIVKPALVIFVKYEFWYYYLKKVKYRRIPFLLISASFRDDMTFFKWYGAVLRKMLSRFDHLFVQNKESKRLMAKIGLAAKTSISGDTRFDRVSEIAEKFEPIILVEQFIGNKKTVIAGSTWKEDEEIISRYNYQHQHSDYKWVIAPHEINEMHLAELKRLFPDSVLFSELTKSAIHFDKPVLIIDNFGMLSKLYRYATITFIGGGFSKGGVHNVLEAAVYGKPVLFGPNYQKYDEAIQLIEKNGAISACSYEEFDNVFNAITRNEEMITAMSGRSKDYVLENRGATKKIMEYIQEKRLLTN